MAQIEGIAPFSQMLRHHVAVVRMFMRDFSELNVLIKGEESSDRSIAWATLDFVSDFNQTPPFTQVDLSYHYRRGWQALAVRGTVITLLQSLTFLYSRNYLPFSDGGISLSHNDKAPMLLQFQQLLQTAYEQNKRAIKTALNIEQLLDSSSSGLFSDYTYLASAYGF